MEYEQKIFAEFMHLTSIPSTSGGEKDTAVYCTRVLREMGAVVTEDEAMKSTGGNAGNIIATFDGSMSGVPPLLLNAHMDTVDPGGVIEPEIRGDRIVSKGNTILGADNRAGIVMILQGLKRILNSGKVFGRIEVVLTVAEENGLVGAAALDYEKISARHGYSFDSSGLGRIGIAAPYYNALDLSVSGRASHAAVDPEKGINSILVVCDLLRSISFGRIDQETTSNVGRITGGKERNVVPAACSASIEIRSHSLKKLERYTEQILQYAQVLPEKWQTCLEGQIVKPRIDVCVHREFDGFCLEEESCVVQCVSDALSSIGRQPICAFNMGGSDANIFNKNGISTAVIGTGQSAVHSIDEFIKTKDLIDGVLLVESVINSWTEWWTHKIT